MGVCYPYIDKHREIIIFLHRYIFCEKYDTFFFFLLLRISLKFIKFLKFSNTREVITLGVWNDSYGFSLSTVTGIDELLQTVSSIIIIKVIFLLIS